MNKYLVKYLRRSFRQLILLTCVLIILVLIVSGCRAETEYATTANGEGSREEENESEEASWILEQPDKELFGKYFSDIRLGSVFLLGGSVNMEENIDTFLPHQKVCFNAGVKNKKNFILRIEVLNLETNKFIERCTANISSEGADGFSIEGILFPVGKYEYRIYVENIFAGALPFDVISYINYFKTRAGHIKS